MNENSPFDDDDHTLSEGRTLMKQGSVEMSYDEVPASSANLAAPWRAIDIVTKNTIYALDARLRCTAVIDRASGEHKEDHIFVGALLVVELGVLHRVASVNKILEINALDDPSVLDV